MAAGAISAQAAALAEGVLKTMMLSKLKTGLVGVLALVIVATGLGRGGSRHRLGGRPYRDRVLAQESVQRW